MTTKLLTKLAIGALLLTPVAAHAGDTLMPSLATGTYALDTSHANVVFKINHLGFSGYMGRFDKMTADLTLDASNLSASKLQVKIDPTSINTNNKKLESELVSDKFFDAKSFPEITFKSTKIDVTGPDTGKITGDLTLHGITKPVTLQTKFNGAGVHPFAGVYVVGFSATTSIKRSDFGMSAYLPQVGDDVTLQIEAEFHKSN